MNRNLLIIAALLLVLWLLIKEQKAIPAPNGNAAMEPYIDPNALVNFIADLTSGSGSNTTISQTIGSIISDMPFECLSWLGFESNPYGSYCPDIRELISNRQWEVEKPLEF